MILIGRHRSWLGTKDLLVRTKVGWSSRPHQRFNEIERWGLKQLVDLYHAPARRLAVSLLGNSDIAEDVLIEVFAKAYWAERRKSR